MTFWGGANSSTREGRFACKTKNGNNTIHRVANKTQQHCITQKTTQNTRLTRFSLVRGIRVHRNGNSATRACEAGDCGVKVTQCASGTSSPDRNLSGFSVRQV